MDLTLRIGLPSPSLEIPFFYPDPIEPESFSPPKLLNLLVPDVISSGRSSEASPSFPVPPPPSDLASSRVKANFECNICGQMAKDPVVTLCGHLFCWVCAYRWFSGSNCPVCENQVDVSTLVPIYARGSFSDRKQERDDDVAGLLIPPRPHANTRKRKRADSNI